jgi:hypothetical protein
MNPSPRTLLVLASVNAALHAAGLAVAALGMLPGSPVTPLAERMAYLAERPPAWSWGWGLWMLCALVLVAFMALLRRMLPGDPFAAQLAVVLTAAGMAVDLLCDALQIQVLPLAAGSQPAVFLAFEQLAFFGGVTVANGLYVLGVLLMNLCLSGVAGPPARLAGWVTVVSGFALAVAGFVPSPVLLQAATGSTIVFYSLWTVLVARDIHKARR